MEGVWPCWLRLHSRPTRMRARSKAALIRDGALAAPSPWRRLRRWKQWLRPQLVGPAALAPPQPEGSTPRGLGLGRLRRASLPGGRWTGPGGAESTLPGSRAPLPALPGTDPLSRALRVPAERADGLTGTRWAPARWPLATRRWPRSYSPGRRPRAGLSTAEQAAARGQTLPWRPHPEPAPFGRATERLARVGRGGRTLAMGRSAHP
mmetsp:Transcript_1798/g.7126  ORF Transcript_1798/g.7126 Transcript_1798/m.7126 type:complete len:207 (-) Transcript_1798:994-1614(-)